MFLNHSDLSAVNSTLPQTHKQHAVVPHQPSLYLSSFCSVFSLPHSHAPQFPAFFTRSYPFTFYSSSMSFICSLSSYLFLPTSSLSPFSCHPPALLLSHAPVGEHNKMVVAVLCIVCVFVIFCVMSHYNGSIVALFFNP